MSERIDKKTFLDEEEQAPFKQAVTSLLSSSSKATLGRPAKPSAEERKVKWKISKKPANHTDNPPLGAEQSDDG